VKYKKGKAIKLKTKSASYIALSNAYATLPAFLAPPDPPLNKNPPLIKPPTSLPSNESHYRQIVAWRLQAKLVQQLQQLQEDDCFDESITIAKDEQTTMAKNDPTNVRRVRIDTAHSTKIRPSPTLLQRGRNAGYALSATFR